MPTYHDVAIVLMGEVRRSVASWREENLRKHNPRKSTKTSNLNPLIALVKRLTAFSRIMLQKRDLNSHKFGII